MSKRTTSVQETETRWTNDGIDWPKNSLGPSVPVNGVILIILAIKGKNFPRLV